MSFKSSPKDIELLLSKVDHYDKDERYMALNDLSRLIENDVKIDDATERKLCGMILSRLDDSSNDVQTMAVKALGTILKKVQNAQVNEICKKLCDLILSGKKELRGK